MNALIPHLSVVDNWHESMLNLVCDLANMNSGTFNLNGLEEVHDRLRQEFEVLDGITESVPSLPYQVVNSHGELETQQLGRMLHVRKRTEAKFKVLLCIHMDTVYPANHPFQSCEMLENGHLNGPGVSDAKGGIVVLLNALKAFEASPIANQIGWEVLINADEEIGSPGSIQLIEQIANRCNVGLLFEPSLPDGTLVSWRKGSGNFSFVVRGRSAHAGREFDKGRNAIVAACRLLDAIDQFNVDPEVTFNAGRISGGGPLNVVPEMAIGRVNVRVKTPEQQRDVENKFAELVRQFNELDGITVEMHGEFSSPPKPLTQDVAKLQTQIEACGEALGINVGWRGTGGACDGNKFAAAGLPNIDTLGPRGGDIHSPKEYLIPESLVPCTKLTTLILLDYAAQQLKQPSDHT